MTTTTRRRRYQPRPKQTSAGMTAFKITLGICGGIILAWILFSVGCSALLYGVASGGRNT